MGTVIAVASGKGGTGKTSLTSGVSTCLAALGKKVLCIDLDIGLRNLDISLGMTDRVLMDFTDIIEGRCTLERGAAEHPIIKDLHLLTAPISLPFTPIDEGGMITLLKEARREFDYILLDAPAGIGTGFRLATCNADRALLVSVSDMSTLRDAQRTSSELLKHMDTVHLIMNRVRPKLLRKMHTTIDDAMNTAGVPLLGVVPEDIYVTLAANKSEPLILSSRKGAATAYLNIAKRITGETVPLMKLIY